MPESLAELLHPRPRPVLASRRRVVNKDNPWVTQTQRTLDWADVTSPASAYRTMPLLDVKKLSNTDEMFYKGVSAVSQGSESIFSILQVENFTKKYSSQFPRSASAGALGDRPRGRAGKRTRATSSSRGKS